MSRSLPSLLACLPLVCLPLLGCDRHGGERSPRKDEASVAASAPPSSADDGGASPGLAAAEPPAPSCPKVDGERVSLMAEDGVELAADHYSGGAEGRPGVVLLHMIPPHHDLDNYPRSFIDTLVAAGYDVINVNRRGAPGSKGIAEQAYEGDKGKLDVLAGVRFLLDSPCKIDPNKLVIVGASNGTTSMVDYTIHASETDAAKTPSPAALVFLSGGRYSENQHALSESLDVLGAIPALFAYPQKEAAWNDQTKQLAAEASIEGWSFHVYEPGGHGTNLFKTDPELGAELVTWLDAKLGT